MSRFEFDDQLANSDSLGQSDTNSLDLKQSIVADLDDVIAKVSLAIKAAGRIADAKDLDSDDLFAA